MFFFAIGSKRPRSTSSSTRRQSSKGNDERRRSSTSPWAAKFLKRHKRRHHRHSDIEPKTSTPNRTSTIITPCPSMDHNYLLATTKTKSSPKKSSKLLDNDLSSNDNSEEEEDDDDERDSNSIKRKSIITTRAQAAARNYSKNRRKSSPPKKRLTLPLTTHRANTRINRRIIEHDLKLLRQGNILPPLSPPTNQQPLDLSLGPNRSSSYEDIHDKTTSNIQIFEQPIEIKQATPVPIEGVLDLSLSR